MNKFIATVTPASIDKRDTKDGVRYSYMGGATVQRRSTGGKMKTEIRTVMAFGRNNAAVANILRVGKPIQVQCVFDKRSIRIIGKAPKTAAKPAKSIRTAKAA